MSTERQVLEGLVEKAKQRFDLAEVEYKRWRDEVNAASVALNAYESALETYRRDNGIASSADVKTNGSFSSSTAVQQNFDLDFVQSLTGNEDEEVLKNDEETFGKSFILRNVFDSNREKRWSAGDIIDALPKYSTIDRTFLSKVLPKFLVRGELIKDDDGLYHVTEKLVKPERRVGRVKIAA